MTPHDRDLPIGDSAGHRRYLGRPPFFGCLDPDSLEGFFATRAQLERAEREGPEALREALAAIGLESAEPWWHIEASFYQRHMIEGPGPTQATRPPTREAPRRGRAAHGTPAPQLLTHRRSLPRRADSPSQPQDAPPPVPFEVFCEIAGAQAAWSSAGLDPAIEASRHFLLELEELIAVELYWAAELAKSRELARQFARKMLEYKEIFSGG